MSLRRNVRSRAATCLRIAVVVALLPCAAAAQVDELRMPVIIDADRTDYDGKTSMLRFTGLRLTQGGTSIYADVAHASRMDFDDSVWRFSGNVVFDVNEGRITCDSADLRFVNFELEVATIEGSPATFDFQRPGGVEKTHAEARRLHYDVGDGVIEFSGSASITEGGNQISSESLVYDINAQRINAVSTGDGDDRVKVTFTPPAAENDEAAEQGRDEPAVGEEPDP